MSKPPTPNDRKINSNIDKSKDVWTTLDSDEKKFIRLLYTN